MTFLKPKQLQETDITVDMLTVADITNVRASKPKAKEVKKPDQAVPSSATPPKKALAEPVHKEEPKVKPTPRPIQERVIEPLPKAVVKKEEKPKPEEKQKEEIVKKEEVQEDHFAAVLKSIEEMKPEQEVQEKAEEDSKGKFDEVEDFLSNIPEDSYQPGIPLSLSERDAIHQQIMRNWTVLGGARDAASMQVQLQISLALDGSVTEVEILDTGRYQNDGYYRAMADSAVRAVQKSSPLRNLPQEKYEGKDGWKRIELTFDPSEMLY
jgi:hypothetical protein